MRLSLLVVSVCLCICSASDPIFFDDFDTLDCSQWIHEITLAGGGNWEFEYYTNNRTNSFVRDSVLFIQPTLTADTIGEANLKGTTYTMDVWGNEPANLCTGNGFYGCSRTAGGGGNYLNPIQSARLRTAESFHFTYGQMEVRAKLPAGDWIWPAIWLLPRYNSYGDWPASGEIDIMESRGNDASYTAGGNNQIASTLHWGPYGGLNRYTLTHQTFTLPSGDFSQDFHIFGLKWSADNIQTYVDDTTNVVLNIAINESFWDFGAFPAGTNNPWEGRPNNAPFDQDFYIVFNVAVGGTNGYFPDGVGGKPWTDADSHAVNEFYDAKDSQWYPTWQGDNVAMQIDYIKVWGDS